MKLRDLALAFGLSTASCQLTLPFKTAGRSEKIPPVGNTPKAIQDLKNISHAGPDGVCQTISAGDGKYMESQGCIDPRGRVTLIIITP